MNGTIPLIVLAAQRLHRPSSRKTITGLTWILSECPRAIKHSFTCPLKVLGNVLKSESNTSISPLDPGDHQRLLGSIHLWTLDWELALPYFLSASTLPNEHIGFTWLQVALSVPLSVWKRSYSAIFCLLSFQSPLHHHSLFLFLAKRWQHN